MMFGSNEAIDQLAMTNIVPWHGNVLRMALVFYVEVQKKKERPKRT